MPENLSQERRDAMVAYGAELILVSEAAGMEGARDLANTMEKEGRETKCVTSPLVSCHISCVILMVISGHLLYCFTLFYFLFYIDGDLRTFTLLFYVVLFLVLY
jgi:cysteine synthase